MNPSVPKGDIQRSNPRMSASSVGTGALSRIWSILALQFVHHTLETPWSEAQLAYFAGTAMWTYLNVPFVLDWKGVETQEAGSWIENGETWHRLTVHFPPSIPTHCSVQTLYADDQGLLRRHDYDLEIAGNTPAAHYIMGYVEVGGLWFPTRRRIFARQPDGTPLVHPVVVAIDIDSIELS